jgi:hypothetical protein
LIAVEELAPERAAAFARAYNRWLRDYCRLAPERLLPVGVLSLRDPESAVRELERVASLGWRAPMWFMKDTRRLAAIHAGTVAGGTIRKAIVMNDRVRAQIRQWLQQTLPPRP